MFYRCWLFMMLFLMITGGKTVASTSFVCLTSQELLATEHLEVSAIDLNPDGTILAAATITGIQLYSADTLEIQMQLLPKEELAFGGTAIKWSPDGSMIAAYVSSSVGIRIWDVNRGVVLNNLIAPEDNPLYPVSSMDWSHNGQYLASAGVDSPIRIWEINSSQLLWEYPVEYGLQTNLSNLISWSPVENQLAFVEGNEVSLWKIEGNSDIAEVKSVAVGLENIIGVKWYSDDQLVALEANTFSVHELENNEWQLRDLPVTSTNILAFTLIADGATFIGGTDTGDIVIQSLQFENSSKVITGYVISTVRGHLNTIFNIVGLADDKTMFSINLAYAVYKWDIDGGCVVSVLQP